MDKTDDNRLTNQPETVTIPSPVLSRVMGCWDAGEFGQRLNLLRDNTCTDMNKCLLHYHRGLWDAEELWRRLYLLRISRAEVDESEIFVFGGVSDGGAKLAEAEAAMTLPGEGLTPSSWGDTADFVRHGDDRRGFRAELITFFICCASDRPGVQFRISIIDFIAIVQSQNWGGGGGRGAMWRRRQLAQFGYPKLRSCALVDRVGASIILSTRDEWDMLESNILVFIVFDT
eukprot:scaffold38199_cov54-Cyclotella_meneghiniana.AAC.1